MTMPRPSVRPRPLAPGAHVALVAPAGPLDEERIERSEARCRALGLEPVVFPAATARRGFLAGSDEQRLADLQAAFDDPSIDAVWALRGGYGTMRIAPRLDLSRLRRDPIPYIGFSDNTAVLGLVVRAGVIAYHGPHPGGDFPPETETVFRRMLFGEDGVDRIPLVSRAGDPSPRALVEGRAEGPLVGGNLAILAATCGTPLQVRARGCVLALEDVGEPAYRIDRMLWQLEHAGVTDGVSGLALGRFTDLPEGEADAVEQVLAEFAHRLGVPTVADLPFGHVAHNHVLALGSRAEVRAGGDEAALTMSSGLAPSR